MKLWEIKEFGFSTRIWLISSTEKFSSLASSVEKKKSYWDFRFYFSHIYFIKVMLNCHRGKKKTEEEERNCIVKPKHSLGH